MESYEAKKATFRIMFVCLGNICRSPAAQGVLESLVQKQGLESTIKVDSAGTAYYHIGRLPDSRMRAAALRRGYELVSLAKAISQAHMGQRDLILAMDRENFSEIARLSNSSLSNVRLLSDYLDDTWPRDVPDPYFGGENGFEYVLDMLEAACPRVLTECLQSLKRDE